MPHAELMIDYRTDARLSRGLGKEPILGLGSGGDQATSGREDEMTVPADTLPSHPVLFINPRSGGGKAQHHHLVDHCRQKRIEPIVLEEGDDLASLAAAAVSSGADAIGMAGGDGSQAEVAAVAAAHDLPYVCVPAGTRNHFALDIGIDRDDVVGALDAFHHGSERRIDLAQVNGRVFVNNASMGLYGKIVQSPEYRDAKLRTVIEMLPDLLGPDAEPFDLRFTGPDGAEYRGAQLVLVSNNPYKLDPVGTSGVSCSGAEMRNLPRRRRPLR